MRGRVGCLGEVKKSGGEEKRQYLTFVAPCLLCLCCQLRPTLSGDWCFNYTSPVCVIVLRTLCPRHWYTTQTIAHVTNPLISATG